MANLSPNSPLYSNYQILIRDLEMELPKQQVVLHVEGGPVCESCQ